MVISTKNDVTTMTKLHGRLNLRSI